MPTVTDPLPHDSFMTVRLSEPTIALVCPAEDIGAAIPHTRIEQMNKSARHISAGTIARAEDHNPDKHSIYEEQSGIALTTTSAMHTTSNIMDTHYERQRSDSDSSGSSVNWEVLERVEDQEPRNQDTKDVSQTF